MNCNVPISSINGYGIQPKIGLRYNFGKGKFFNYLTELGISTYYYKSIGDYKWFWTNDTYKFSIHNYCYGPYLIAGIEFDISKRIFISNLINFSIYKREYKSKIEGYNGFYNGGSNIWLESNIKTQLNFELRLGYRF